MIYGIVFAISIAVFGLWGSVKVSACVLLIGILIAVVYNYLPQLKEVFLRFRPEKTNAPDTNSTQKINAIGKTIFGAFKKVIYWGLILGLIAGIGLALYCFLFPSVDTIYFTPNQWSKKDYGWQKIIKLEESGTYEIKVSGSYNQCFLRNGEKELWRISPHGMTRRNWPSAEYRQHLPLPNRRPFMVIAIIDGKTIPVGYGRKIKANKPITIYLNINIPQNWAEVPGKTPADNFVHNRGSLQIEIEKDWAMFLKIAEILHLK